MPHTPGDGGGLPTRATTHFVDPDDLACMQLRRKLSRAAAAISALEAANVPEMLELAPHADLILLDVSAAGDDPRQTVEFLRDPAS